mgnify:CR=1 FL=1
MTHRFSAVIAAALLTLLTACQSVQESTEASLHSQPFARNAVPYLEEDYARMRAGQISDVAYQLSVILDPESEQFSAILIANFTVAKNNRAAVTIDFNGGEIKNLSLNGKPVAWDYNNWFITLAAEDVRAGKNQLHVKYSRPYATDGDGLHRYIDPETGNHYLYTNFEPYNANKLFPHFDQPNIKAKYTLDVKAPTDWQVISGTRENNVEESNGYKHWFFPETAPIASYIFPLHAGPYFVWEDSYSDGNMMIPLRLFARQEIAEYVKEEDWFTFTKQSFGFFNGYFEQPYMFGKYDQIIVPDFNAGAMENLAAVTFTEHFVSRGIKVESQRIRLANVIAHEMAHMWFGNLVTMDWWSGLWLNESFATYMANLQLNRASDFENTWDIFYASTKQWAYTTDQQVTTHPIQLPVPSTADAFTNFDGITYGKGASVLKQLPYYLGEENFRQGVANYLRTHAYGNTELMDFTRALGNAANKNLDTWTEEWLYQAGLNSVQAQVQCDGDILQSLTLNQTAPQEHPTLRAQRVQVGLFSLDTDEEAQLFAALPVTYQGAHTSVAIPQTTPCPDFVYPNLDDWGYVKIHLDDKSHHLLQSRIQAFTDDGLRIMLWQGMWDSVRDVNWPLTKFVKFAVDQLPAEHDDRIINQMSSLLGYANDYLWLMDPQGNQLAPVRHDIEQLLWTRVVSASPGSDQQKIWFDQWVEAASETQHLQQARALLKADEKIKGFTLDQDRRWRLVLLLNRFAYRDYETVTREEAQRDGSDRGQLNLLMAQATRPSATVKEEWLRHLFARESTYKLTELRAVMTELFPANQLPLFDRYSGHILAALPQLASEKEERFIALFTRNLLPATCSTESVNALHSAISDYANLSPSLDKALLIAHQEDQRCVAMKRRVDEALR